MEMIKKNIAEDELYVKPIGRIDISVAYEFEHDVTKMLAGMKKFTLDLDNVEYISSVGLRAILGFQKVMDGQGVMEITNVQPEIMEIFQIVGFDKILNIV